LASLIQRVETITASAREEEASRLFKIAQQTYDHLASNGLFRPHGRDLHSIGDSVMCDFERLLFKRRQTRVTDSQLTGVSVVDPESSRISAQEDKTTTHELKNVTRDEVEQVSDNFYEAAKSLLMAEEKKKREREKEDEEENRGRSLLQYGTKPLAEGLNEILVGVDEFHNSWVPPE
jgi:cbb3-type cytochrome oxidase cytochrome c subunit